jgi:uncharacterized membrane protein
MKKHVKILIAVLLFAACILIPPVTHAEEYIKAFDALITINQDSSVSIEESIVYFTDEPKHGIFRYIPFLLRSDEDVKITRISDVSIIDEFNNPVPFTQSTSNEFTEFKIGDPHTTFEGDKTYVIRYKVNQALERFSEHDELYWDITGEGWEFPIQASRARIHSPFALIERVDCFSGAAGSNNAACDSKIENDNNATFTYDQTIEYGENVTVAVSLKRPNQLLFPKISSSIAIAWINRIAYALASLPVIVMFLLWYTFGRDYVSQSPNVFNSDNSQPQRKKGVFERFRVPFVYEPLSISPGEAGVMLDEKADANDVIAEIVELARKKYLSIDFIEKKGMFGKSDYSLIKLKAGDDALTQAQRYLHTHLFSGNENVNLSKLKGSFFPHFEKTKQLLEQSVTSHNFFTQPISRSRGAGIALAFVANIIIGIMLFIMIFLSQSFAFMAVYLVGLPLSLLLGWNLMQKTISGTNAMLQAKGLKETLRLAKWRDEIKEKHLFIEAIIPYSIALGVIDKLSKDMDDLGIKPPEYISRGFTRGTTLNAFTNGFSSSATSSLAYNPNSSSRSSGSGFSGGSSGGGGGGGGGGSW